MMIVIALFLALVSGAPAIQIADAGTPSVAQVLAKAKQAAGGSAVDKLRTLHYQERVNVLGITGDGEEWDDLTTGRFASFQHAGVLSNGDGFDGSTAWSQDATGLAHPTAGVGDMHQALSQAYFVALGYWYAQRMTDILKRANVMGAETSTPSVKSVIDKGKQYYAVSLTAGTSPAECWFDSTTYLLARAVVHASALRSVRVDFSDYRKVAGVTIPFSTRVEDNQGNTFATTVTSAEPNVSVEGRFAMPTTVPSDFSMAPGTTSTTFPIQLVNNHIFLDAKVNDEGPFHFIFDTGGQGILNPDVAQKLGIQPEGAMQAGGAGSGTVQTGFAWVPKVQLGGATMTHQAFAILPLGQVMQAVEGVHIDGMVGFETVARYVMSIDYAHETMTLTMPGPNVKPAGVQVPFVFVQTVPEINATVDSLPGQFIVDTGNRNSLVLYSPFVDHNGLRAKYAPKVSGVAGYGIGGPTTAQLTRVASVQIGSINVVDVLTGLSTDTTGALADPYISGNIGGGLLQRFTVTFDYPDRVMYLDRGVQFDQATVVDRSGLVLVAARTGIRAIGVLSNTPASEAGITPGDTIVTVNGKPAGDVGLLGIRTLLHGPPGTVVKLTVMTGTQTRDVTLTLRNYV